MTNEQLKILEDNLWDAANNFRANSDLKSSEYATPVLGLIFLKFADNKYQAYEKAIDQEYVDQSGRRFQREKHEIAIEKCGFYLPDYARYDYLLSAEEGGKEVKLEDDTLKILSTAQLIKRAMKGIEQYQDEKFQDVLPKDQYDRIEKSNKTILPNLLATFNDIPKDASGDVFGKIYEYFLGKFALSEGQKGGQFFTPTSVVRLIVEIIEPFKGRVYDPACGSGGMFVQSAKFIERHRSDTSDIYVEGQEKTGDTVRLAKMNLLVNGLRGEIKQANSYADDPFESYGKFDYVMANPPFNVKTVKEDTVKDDPRFTEYGLPKTKGSKKTQGKITDANYLWISLFASSLNDNGRAGFVMANSASDARNAEYEIRKRIVDSGIVDVMVSMPSNMFFTVTLPATLWFFDKGKRNSERKNKVLFIDARETYRQIDRAHREFTEEQVLNLAAIVRLYRKEHEEYLEVLLHHLKEAQEHIEPALTKGKDYAELLNAIRLDLLNFIAGIKEKLKPAQQKKLIEEGLEYKLEQLLLDTSSLSSSLEFPAEVSLSAIIQAAEPLTSITEFQQKWEKGLSSFRKELEHCLNRCSKSLKVKGDKSWNDLELNRAGKVLDESAKDYVAEKDQIIYYYKQFQWLQERFPEGKYQDINGLCKVADREEVLEQDYSLNPGRYVGIRIEEENLSEEEFSYRIQSLHREFIELDNKSITTSAEIKSTIKTLINELG